MTDLATAIAKAGQGDETDLLEAVKMLPSRPAYKTDPMGDDDPGPIPGPSFDDVTAAWIAGALSDAAYDRAIAAAGGVPTGG